MKNSASRNPNRRGITIVYTSIFLVVMFAMAAFAIEVGSMMVARTKMQTAADAAALAAAAVLARGDAETFAMAQQYAGYHEFFGDPIQLQAENVKIGFWDADAEVFTQDPNGNAVEVVAIVENVNLIFGSFIGTDSYTRAARAVAVAPARDICFVVDLSGSMNDDTEPAWATKTIDDMFASTSYAGVGSDLIQDLYTDFGFGSYPGTLEDIGYTLGMVNNDYTYAEMTKDDGPLADGSMDAAYRILSSDSEWQRRNKCYSYIIDNEIAAVMPDAKPTPDSTTNFEYWSRYLDYVVKAAYIHSVPYDPGDPDDPSDPSDPPEPPAIGMVTSSPFQLAKYRPIDDDYGSPPVDRGWVPPTANSDRIYKFNNPNTYAFSDADTSTRWAIRNKIGYQTYVQFMLDYGREDKPDGVTLAPISLQSADCPMHLETTDGGDFLFPPRTQPMHSCRRALISALKVIKDRNQYFSEDQKDRVSIITFDRLSTGTETVQTLTDDYDAAMLVCTELQASIDKGQTTATELGLSAARNYIKQDRDGGSGRNNVNKVVVLLTDGLPNDFVSDPDEISTYMGANPNDDFYAGGYDWLDAPLMQTKIMSRKGWQVHPVGIGFGTDYDFMDRMARMGGTSQAGVSLRGSGNPALYEQRLRELFQQIVEDPMVNLAQ